MVFFEDLGPFTAYLYPFLDDEGKYPQAGDRPEDFVYSRVEPGSGSDWDAWVEEAAGAMCEAEGLYLAWRDGRLRRCGDCGLPFDVEDDEGIEEYHPHREHLCLGCWSDVGSGAFPGSYPAEVVGQEVGKRLFTAPLAAFPFRFPVLPNGRERPGN